MNNTIDRLRLTPFGNLELLAKQVVEGFITGLHKSPFHGFSVEFAEHRLYNSGESTRHIDWKLYARSEKLFTKKYEEETNLRCQIVIDGSSSMYFPKDGNITKYEFATYAAASLIELLRKQRDAVGLSIFTDKLDIHTAVKSSTAHHRFLYTELEKRLRDYEQSERKSTATIQSFHDVAELCHQRSLIIIFTDLLDDPNRIDELFQAFQHMKHNKHEVILFHVNQAKTEIDFNLDNRPYQLIDMETGESMMVQPAEMRTTYVDAMQRYMEEIKLRCANHQIDFVQADIDGGYNDVLIHYLLKRQRLH
jgi:uncharacterized protein (DUF58 family)